MKIKSSYFKKLFVYSIFIILITIFINYILNIVFLDSFYISRKKENMKNVSSYIKNVYNNYYDIENLKGDVADLYGIDMKIISKNSVERNNRSFEKNSSMNIKNYMPMNQNLRHSRIKFIDKKFTVDTLPNIRVKLLIYTEQLPTGDWMYLSTSLSVMKSYKHEFNLFNILTTLITICFASIVAHIFSKKHTRDINILTEKAEKIALLKFPENIIIDREDEIGRLSHSLNKMSKNLKINMDNLKSFVSNASHELKTPISIISTHAQALVSGNISIENTKKYNEIILKETQEMESLVSNLLIISKLDSLSTDIIIEKINLLELIKNSLEKYEFLELEKDINVTTNIYLSEFNGNYSLIKIAIDNIIQNALKYSIDLGEFSIYTKENTLYFENETFETSQEQIETLWAPFERGKNSIYSNTEGYGLGLSIVKKILELHKLKNGIKLEKIETSIPTKYKFIIWFQTKS